jgi:phage baseplate assembly protein gpV
MRGEAARVMAELSHTRMGLVDGYDPENYAVRVRFQPEDKPSGWLPLQTLRAGNGAGVYAPPNLGDQVVVAFQEADRDAGVVLGALYNDEDKPLPVPAGEIWMVHEGGAAVKISATRVEIIFGPVTWVMTQAGIAITGGTLTHNGVNVGATHRHTAVQFGGSTSGPPSP